MPPIHLPPRNGTLGYGMNGSLFEKLPDSFQCKVCQKSKESSPFFYSKKELKTFVERAQRGQRLDSVTAKLRCRECSGDPPDGIFCMHCEMIKPRDDFSQAARNRPAEAWCRPCVYWQESVEPAAKTLPLPSSAAPKEGEKKYAPESADERAACLAKAHRKTSSLKSLSVAPSYPVADNVSNWLNRVNFSQPATSLLDEEDVKSTINYSSTTSAFGYHAGGEDDGGTPKATSSLFKHILHHLPNTPASLLDMDDEGSLQLTTTMKPLTPKALFSNTILTPTRKTTSQVALESTASITNDENWQAVQYKKKKSPIKANSSSDGSPNHRNQVAYGVNPDGTYKWRPKDESDFNIGHDVHYQPRHHITARGNHVKQQSVLQRDLEELEPEDSDLDDDLLDSKFELVAESPDLLDSKAFYAPSLKSHKSLLDDDIPSISKVDYSCTFSGIDPFSKNNRGVEADDDMVEAKSVTTDQRSKSSTSATDILDDQLFESAIRHHAMTATTPPSTKEGLNLSIPTADPSHSDLPGLDSDIPSLSRELAAAGILLGDEAIIYGSGDATTRAPALFTSFGQLQLACIIEEHEDECDDYRLAYVEGD